MEFREMIFDARKNFFNLWIVWTVIGFVTLVALVITFSITETMPPVCSGEPFHERINKLLVFYKVPIGIMALLIPLLASLNSAHRSEQTRVQIETANSQNLFQNHFKHIEEFEKYIKTHIPFADILIGVRQIYNKLFPGSRDGNFETSYDLRCFITEKSVLIIRSFENFNVSEFTNNEAERWLRSIFSSVTEIETYIGIKFPEDININKLEERWKYKTEGPYYRRVIDRIIVRLKLVSEVMAFSNQEIPHPLAIIVSVEVDNAGVPTSSNNHPPQKGFDLFSGIETRGT
jgi:hypothetical protein|tara:strand:+ start:8066 stop:8932 length:867 start_codon:yes stop_codon:yes gene_type:complete